MRNQLGVSPNTYSYLPNKREGPNKQGGWKIFNKLINREGESGIFFKFNKWGEIENDQTWIISNLFHKKVLIDPNDYLLMTSIFIKMHYEL